jgi:UDP-3-O-[3-hydroxymyristoyl] glucosamine N-acyltransferase
MPRKSNLYYLAKKASLGKNVNIGFNAYIGEGARIGDNVRIDQFATILQGSISRGLC